MNVPRTKPGVFELIAVRARQVEVKSTAWTPAEPAVDGE
jgi:hypothetical protein